MIRVQPPFPQVIQQALSCNTASPDNNETRIHLVYNRPPNSSHYYLLQQYKESGFPGFSTFLDHRGEKSGTTIRKPGEKRESLIPTTGNFERLGRGVGQVPSERIGWHCCA